MKEEREREKEREWHSGIDNANRYAEGASKLFTSFPGVNRRADHRLIPRHSRYYIINSSVGA